ncbi:phosphonatase-like hydrolase [Myroides fluvii]|uniref:phosphonatase-like hydrolase n=1 Tax=Myroides fluvii TaxID=2572594 RepID=UPI00131B61B0|nr:phosphonatase-like hydrolase [Myroides fluvii]
MKNIALVVFDMAGTTVDEDNLVYKTVCKVIREEGYEVNLEQTLIHGAGKEKLQAIKDILHACTDEKEVEQQANLIFRNFKKQLEDAYTIFPVKTFDGMEDFFKVLRAQNIKVVLNTGYDAKTANKLLDKLNWRVGTTIDGLITSDDVKVGRPSPEMIQLAMKQFDIVDAQKVLKAGDSIIDIEEGKNANCGMVVGVLTGAQNRALLETAEPTLIVNALVELQDLLV